MSTRSPTLTPSRFFLSSTLKLIVRPSSVFTVTDGTLASSSVIVTVADICSESVPDGWTPVPRTRAGPLEGAGAGPPGLERHHPGILVDGHDLGRHLDGFALSHGFLRQGEDRNRQHQQKHRYR